MHYGIALVFPPVAILISGRLFQAVLNFLLCCVSIALICSGTGFLVHIAPVVWALAVVHGTHAETPRRAN